ncbi:MAG: 7-cyano-7-deazaguanine synthase [Phycisphaeraceae bacterium]|nr:7-cyano-7-deazaguanine synthase [Phycisphaeraceae bacterium]
MPNFDTMIMNSGGLRSLIATGMGACDVGSTSVAMLHFQQRHVNTRNRMEAMQQQAEHFEIEQVVRSEMATLISNPGQSVREDDMPDPVTFYRVQMLIAALAQAIEFRVKRLIVPFACNADHDRIARITEQLTLVLHLVELDDAQAIPVVEMPLLELTDRELIELGEQMQVPWSKSWSCRNAGDEPCGGCPACVSRSQAFQEAGVSDE